MDWVAGAVASVIVQGCFSSAIDDANCAFKCNPDCPSGFRCDAGFCVRPGYTGTCSESGGEEEDDLGRRGSVQFPPGGCTGGTILSAEPLQPVEACTGKEVSVELTVSGGTPPYYWSLTDAPDGLTLSQSQSATVLLRGAFTESGNARVQVQVQSGDDCSGFSVPVSVHETPRVSFSFEDSCVGQSYERQLTAEGGDVASYEWSVSGLPVGVDQRGGRISGNAPEAPGKIELGVSLRDQYCASEPRLFAWNIKAPGQCPIIGPLRLPAPCAGVPYEETLIPNDGAGPDYAWSVVTQELPAGLNFDPATGVIWGTPTGNGPSVSGRLDVVLSDSEGQAARAEFDLSLRQSCWLAYVSDEIATRRVHLRDVFLKHDILLPAAPLAAGESVVDFELSPDGAWVAFRAGPPDRLRLYLYPSAVPRPGDAAQVAFDCPEEAAPCGVLDYAWSPTSDHVAVVLSGASDAQDYLSGVDVSAPGAPWLAVGLASWDGDLIPLDYHRELVWAAHEHVAFTGLDPDRPSADRDLVYLAKALLQIEPVATIAGGTGIKLRPTPRGLISFDPGLLAITALDLSGQQEDMTPHGEAWVSPSGNFVGKTTDDGRLQVFDFGGASARWELPQRTCGAVVSWAPPIEGIERLICSDGPVAAPTGENLRVVDLDTAESSSIVRSVPTNGTYIPDALANTRRVISPSGNWLLVGSPANGVAVVDISTTSPVIPAPQNELTLSAPAEIEFAPSGRAVAVYDATGLSQYTIPIAFGKTKLSDVNGQRLEPPSDLSTCQENALELPERWCGAERIPGHFKWSHDSQSLLFEDASGSLWLADPRSSPQRSPLLVTSTIASCAAPCRERPYAFLP